MYDDYTYTYYTKKFIEIYKAIYLVPPVQQRILIARVAKFLDIPGLIEKKETLECDSFLLFKNFTLAYFYGLHYKTNPYIGVRYNPKEDIYTLYTETPNIIIEYKNTDPLVFWEITEFISQDIHENQSILDFNLLRELSPRLLRLEAADRD